MDVYMLGGLLYGGSCATFTRKSLIFNIKLQVKNFE